MKSEKPNRAVRWLNMLLLVINLTVIATILIQAYGGPGGGAASSPSESVASLDFLRRELGLTDEQYRDLARQNDQTFRTYNILVDLLCEANLSLLEELLIEESTQSALDSLTRKIGTLNSSIKRETVKHFLAVKNVCDEDQRHKLTLIFKKMMELEEQCESCNKKECPRKERLVQLGK